MVCYRPRQTPAAIPEKLDEDRVTVDALGPLRPTCPSALVGDFHRPVFGEQGFAVARVRLAENGLLPVTDVGFGKVSKQTRCLDSFCVHVRAFVCLHDLLEMILGQR